MAVPPFLEARFTDWVLAETARARSRVRELKDRYPSAPASEHAQRLIDDKKRWAATGGAVSGVFGLLTLPADLALVSYLQLSLIVEIAVLHDRHLKSAGARRELLQIFFAGNTAARAASRASPKAAARIAERLLAAKGMRFLSRLLPVLSVPLTAALNHRDLDKVGEEALRHYRFIPRALGR